jgi:hypothetical protein
MSKTVLLAFLVALVPTAADAAPASIWTLEYREPATKKDPKEYVLHPPGTSSTPMTYADAKVAIDAKVQKGEWVVNGIYFARRWKEAYDLLDRARSRGAFVVEANEVMDGTIVGVPLDQYREHTQGYITSLKVDIENKSPYTLHATKLTFGSCVVGNTVTLTKPVAIKPKSTRQVSVTIDPKKSTVPDAMTASCPDGGGWSTFVFVEFTP